MEKQEMEMEMEMEMEDWNGNSCMVVSNHWTGLTQTTSFSVGQKLNCLFSLLIAHEPGQASFFESIEVKGHMHM